jgi:hypothetical protein
MTNFRELLRILGQSQVEFIIVGNLAATVHGFSRFTKDLDIVYRRSPDNVTRLVNAYPSRPFAVVKPSVV